MKKFENYSGNLFINMAHIYDASAAGRLVQEILESYIPAFQKLRDSILVRYGDILDRL